MGRPGTPRVVERAFWRLVRSGVAPGEAAEAVGVTDATWRRLMIKGGGVPTIALSDLSDRYLSFAEREEIALGRARGESDAAIGRRLGRHRSTIGRELKRNLSYSPTTTLVYRASMAQTHAERRARRPKVRKIARCPDLAEFVQGKLDSDERWSPEQISHRLRVEFPDDERMRISHEAIYQAIYVQGRGGLRRDLDRCLRTGRALRKPHRQADVRRERIKDKVMISERPAEVADRAVPGHWEGDLIIGEDSGSAIGTLVERTTRFVMLLHLPCDHGAVAVREAIAAAIVNLPAALRKSLTWDQGIEMTQHLQLSFEADIDVYFCDPHSPWQRGSNENTNGLLRQYFPKGTDLSKHTAEDLARVAAGMNGRPRKTLGWKTPAEALAELLTTVNKAGVATTP